MTTSRTDGTATDSPKPKQARDSLTAVGRLLESLRIEHGYTLDAFASKVKLSRSLISGISHGARPLTPTVVEQLQKELDLSTEVVKRLNQAREDPDYIFVHGPGIRAIVLREEEKKDDKKKKRSLKEVWIVDALPLECEEEEYGKTIVANRKDEVRYTYFVTNRSVSDRITLELDRIITLEHKRDPRKPSPVDFVIVPAVLHPYFFRPARVFLKYGDRTLEGRWAYTSADKEVAERIERMDSTTARVLYEDCRRIKTRLERHQAPFSDDPLEFQLVDPPPQK